MATRRARVRHVVIALAIVVAVLAAARLALDPLVTWRTRKILAGLPGMRATFSDVDVRLRDLSYGIRDLRIEKLGAGGAALPFFSAKYAHFGLYWRQLLHGHLVAGVELLDPKLTIVQATSPKKPPPQGAQQIQETPELGRHIANLAPFRIDRLDVKDGEMVWVEARASGTPVLWLHGIEGTLENFATRAALAKDEPTVLAVRAELQRSGKVGIFATADPLAKKLTFAGDGRLQGLRLEELGSFLSPHGVTPEKGTLDMALVFRAKDGRLSGGLRPVLKNASTKPSKPGLLSKLESALADATFHVFSNEAPGQHAVATTIPLTGNVTDPSGQAIPTIVGIIRNAFVRGLSESLRGLPPPKASKPEGALEQARRGLEPRAGEPRAQPKGKK